MIRLLDKRTVHASVSQQRKNDIDAGVELAGKIDVLRSTLSTEQNNLDTFRLQTVKEIQSEIAERITRRNSLDLQIKERTEKLTELRKPLDQAIEKVTEAEAEIEREKVGLASVRHDLEKRYKSLIKSEADIQLENNRIEDIKARAVGDALKSYELLSQTKISVAKMLSESQSTLTATIHRENESIVKEEELKRMDKRISDSIKANEKKEADLVKRERVLADRYATLERNLNRK